VTANTSSSDSEPPSDSTPSNASMTESGNGERAPGATRTASSSHWARSDVLRHGIASVVWLLAVLAALILAVGTLLISLDANADNAYVGWVLDAADRIDWFFWKIFEMKDRTQNHLVNWGLAAVAYLIVGRVADRIIRH